MTSNTRTGTVVVDRLDLERIAVDEGLEHLRAGWTPEEVVALLVDAAVAIAAVRAEAPSC